MDKLKNRRHNLLTRMVSECDQAMKNGYDYEPHHKDIQELREIDEVLNDYEINENKQLGNAIIELGWK